MSLVYLTAGAAGMYCGSCMHDNALAKALIALGEDCLLLPVYTPIRTDEEDVSVEQIFFGGINVYLQQKMPWLAYLPIVLDRGLNHAGLIRRLTQGAMKTDHAFWGTHRFHAPRYAGESTQRTRPTLRLAPIDRSAQELILTNMLIAGCIPRSASTFHQVLRHSSRGRYLYRIVASTLSRSSGRCHATHRPSRRRVYCA